MKGIRSRIIFALATLILMVLIALGLLLGQLFKSFYIDTFEERLEKEAQLLADTLEDKSLLDSRTKNDLIYVSAKLDSSITIISHDGTVLLDTLRQEEKINSIREKIISTNTQSLGFHIIGEDSGLFHYVVQIKSKNKQKKYLILTQSFESFKHIKQQIWALLITSFAIAFLVILMLGTRITSQYTKPIEAATRVANELAKGNYRARTYEDRNYEAGMLTQSVNILARNLQEMTTQQEVQQDRLRTLIESMGSGLILIDGKGYIHLVNRFYLEFFEADADDYIHKLYYHAFKHKEIIDIVEEIFITETQVRKQLQLPINIERRHFEIYGAPIIGLNEEWKGVVLVFHDITELKKLEQMRKDFVANVSHELKTPITSIMGFSETLLDGAMENKDLREKFLQIILKESDRLQSLINDLLDLSKIEQEGFVLSVHRVDLRELIQEVLLILSSKANGKNVNVTSSLGDEIVFIDGDAHRLKQIFINLINNAIMYTASGGDVKVAIMNSGDKVQVIVSDTGIGITKDEIPRIFERFYRIDKARSRNSGGTGLGLAIVKHLVEAHHGHIDVKSQQGEGTAFTVTFKKRFLTNH